MKNHYVSQFIIRRFSKAMNVFDIENRRIDLNKRPEKIFYKDDIYTAELEKLMSYNIESRVANIIDQKILNKDEIIINRVELLILKKYMLLCSVRNLTPDKFVEILHSYTRKADDFLKNCNLFYKPYKISIGIDDLNKSNEEIYFDALKVYCTSKTPLDICKNNLACKEMLAWALPFLDGYLAFWDAPEGKEFILSDCTMVSEYDGFYQMTGGLEISKTSYLLDRIEKKEPVHSILVSQDCMYENYDVFNLSSNRCLVLINPFFRLYHGFKIYLKGENDKDNETVVIKSPDIWPAIIQDRNLFDVPKNEYAIKEGIYTNDDLFIYTPKVLNNDDYIYINSLILRYSKEVIGFDNAKNIIDTIYYSIWEIAQYNSIKKDNNDIITVLKRLMDGIKNSPYNSLGEYCKSVGVEPTVEVVELFERVVNNIYKDFNENRYICEYYLSHQDKIIDFEILDFLGKGKDKIEFFKKHLEEIKSKSS